MSARPRGAVLLFVLVALAAMGVLVAAYYSQAGEAVMTAQAVSSQQLALMKADRGLQEALRRIRTGTLSVDPLVHLRESGVCDQENPRTCATHLFIDQPPIDRGPQELREGGGLDYDFVVFRRDQAIFNKVTIRSTGYLGYALNSPNLISAVVEAEVQVGESNAFRCVDDYECR